MATARRRRAAPSQSRRRFLIQSGPREEGRRSAKRFPLPTRSSGCCVIGCCSSCRRSPLRIRGEPIDPRREDGPSVELDLRALGGDLGKALGAGHLELDRRAVIGAAIEGGGTGEEPTGPDPSPITRHDSHPAGICSTVLTVPARKGRSVGEAVCSELARRRGRTPGCCGVRASAALGRDGPAGTPVRRNSRVPAVKRGCAAAHPGAPRCRRLAPAVATPIRRAGHAPVSHRGAAG
jgi:hypothetical protein